MKKDAESYLKKIVIFASIALVLVTGMSWLVNPFGLFDSPELEGFNLRKTQAYERGRILKAHRPLVLSPQVLIMGNSRVELGLNTDHKAFENFSVYNLGLPGSDLRMQGAYIYNALVEADVKTVVIGIDFLDFLFTEEKPFRRKASEYEFRMKYLLDGSVNDRYQFERLKDYAAAIYSLDSLTASVMTVLSQHSYLGEMTSSGQMTDWEMQKIVKEEGIGVLFTQKEAELRAKLNRQDWMLTRHGEQTSHYFEIFVEFVEQLIQRDINVKVFINPYHRRYIDILTEAGMLNDFLRWKQLLANHLAGVGYFESEKLWDFSVDSVYTMEPVPSTKEKNVFMKWYWEPAHYRHQLGDKILDTLFFEETGFGEELFPRTEPTYVN